MNTLIYAVVSLVLLFGLVFVGVLVDDMINGSRRAREHIKKLEEEVLLTYPLRRAR